MNTNEMLAVKLFDWDENTIRRKRHAYPQWDSSWSGAGEVIEAMREKPSDAMDRFNELLSILRITELTPKAIAKAALAALKSVE